MKGRLIVYEILSILNLVVWSNWYYLYYCSNHYLIHHFKREQKRTALKLEYTYKFFWLKFKQQEWATIYCWSLSGWTRETLVEKYIDLDKEILPKKLGREQGNANKDMNVKWAIYRSLVANNLFKSFLMFSLISRKIFVLH